MLKLISHSCYAWAGLIGAKAFALVGLVSAFRDKDIMNMDADDWFLLSLLYMIFVVAALLARLIISQERASGSATD